MYHTLSLLAILLCATVQHAKSRIITLSVNMSLTMHTERHRQLLEAHHQQLQQEQARPTLTAAVLRSCMKETELSMAELQRFRLSLLTRDPELNATDDSSTQQTNLYDMEEDDFVSEETEIDGIIYETEPHINEPNNNALDYENALTFKSDGKADESLQCYMREELFAKLYAIVGRERHLVKECMNLNTNNKCESSYKMHLCYARLKTLEEENRIRKVLESAYPGQRDDEQSVEIPATEITQENYATAETEATQPRFADAVYVKTENFALKKKLKKLKRKLKQVNSDVELRELLQNWDAA
ncbi:uncharacterized protein Obp56c [Bactrocera oleae]|uniref:uncharacterized protein Obp56c n=1 Tax=Bactrocera oleae TaxID=104688 RepID=UPI00387E9EA7